MAGCVIIVEQSKRQSAVANDAMKIVIGVERARGTDKSVGATDGDKKFLRIKGVGLIEIEIAHRLFDRLALRFLQTFFKFAREHVVFYLF